MDLITQVVPAPLVDTFYGTRLRKQVPRSNRKLSIIPEENLPYHYERNTKRLASAPTASNLDGLISHVFGSVDWDDGQNEIDLQVLYRLHRPDLTETGLSRSRSLPLTFSPIDWDMQSTSADDAKVSRPWEDTTTANDKERSSHSDSEVTKESSNLDDRIEVLMLQAVQNASAKSVYFDSATTERRPKYRAPSHLQTHNLYTPMMTPVNSPMNSVVCC